MRLHAAALASPWKYCGGPSLDPGPCSPYLVSSLAWPWDHKLPSSSSSDIIYSKPMLSPVLRQCDTPQHNSPTLTLARASGHITLIITVWLCNNGTLRMGHSQCKWLVRSQWSVAIWLDGPGWASRASARLPVARWGARLGGSSSPPLAEAPHHTPYHQRSAFYSTDTATLTHSTEWRWHCEIWGGWGQLNYFNLSVGVSRSALGSSQSVRSLLPQQFF